MQFTKNTNLLVALFSGSALVFALVSQHVFDMQPCVWCIAQRMVYIVIFLIAILSLVLKAKWVSSLSYLILALVGAGLAIYQSIIKTSPFGCMRTPVDKFLDWSRLPEFSPEVFQVMAFCSEENSTILGIQYVHWSLMGFGVLGVFVAYKISQDMKPWLNNINKF